MSLRLLRARLAIQWAEERRAETALDALADLAPGRGRLLTDIERRLLDLSDDARDRSGRLLARITALDAGLGLLPVPTDAVDLTGAFGDAVHAESRRALASAGRYESMARIVRQFRARDIVLHWTLATGRAEQLDLAHALSELAERADRERGAA